MNTLSEFTAPGIVFLLTLAAGLWLSRAGKPLNTVIFTIHKLLALGAVVTGGLRMAMLFKIASPPALLATLLILAGLCALALFATGALMSIGKTNYAFSLIVHKIALFLAVIAVAWMAFLLSGLRA